MAEAMTNTEIEDVLSSIRRLVAQESRPAPGRLILTAEHRVAQANLPDPPVAPAPSPAAGGVSAVRAIGLASSAPAPDDPSDVRVQPVDDPVAAPTQPALPLPALDRAGIEAALSEIEAALPPVSPRLVPGAGLRAELPMAPPVSAENAEPDDPADSDLPLIDEADLQRLIARLVREELHGQLGEKITLQVRKLVRAEIARALDERNLLG